MTEKLAYTLLSQSDPANAALVGLVWWRLDRRLRDIRDQMPGGESA